MLEIRPGVFSEIPRFWRLHSMGAEVVLEGSPDGGSTWVPYLSCPASPAHSVVPWKFVGALADEGAVPRADTEALKALWSRLGVAEDVKETSTPSSPSSPPSS